MIYMCVDSGFFFALCDPTDAYHEGAPELYAELFEDIPAVLVAPWPVLYETLNTRFVKREPLIEEMERHLSRLRAQDRLRLVDDSPYRILELDVTLSAMVQPPFRPLSLVDRILRRMIADPTLQIGALLSLNRADFIDVCVVTNCDIIGWP